MSNSSDQKQIKHGREHWQAHMQAWQQSDQTQAAYCEQHGINRNTFVYWRKRFKADRSSVKLVQIPTILSRKPGGCCTLRLIVNEQFVIEVEDGFNPSTLASVIEVVRGQ
jgi:hypothetical protein